MILEAISMIAMQSAPRIQIQCEAPQVAFEWSVSSDLSKEREFFVGDSIRLEVARRLHPATQEEAIIIVQYNWPENTWKHSWSFTSPQGQTGEQDFITDYHGAYMPCRLTKFE